MNRLQPYLIFALISLLLYGLWGFFPKLASNANIDARSILVFEAIGTLAIAFVVLFAIGFKPTFNGKGFVFALLAGIAGAVGSLFFLLALSRGKASVVVTMTALYPLVVIILSTIILKEPITLKQGIGILFALAAVVMFSI
ncbi:MAG: EamA family transporter [Thermoplasmatota archaeon]